MINTPIFADRDALIVWLEDRILGLNQLQPKAQMEALAEVREVVKANNQLLGAYYL